MIPIIMKFKWLKNQNYKLKTMIKMQSKMKHNR